MKKITFSLMIMALCIIKGFAQSGVIAPDKGISIPQFTTSFINAMTTQPKGTVVFDKDLNIMKYWNGTAWQEVSGINHWSLSGTNLNSTYPSFSLLSGTNITQISGGIADDGTLKVYSPMGGPLFTGNQFITIDKDAIQARKSGVSPSFTKTEQNLRLNPFGGNVGIGTNPLAKFHVKYGESGVTPFGIAGFESNIDAFINLISPSNYQSGIMFGSPLSNVRGGIIYNHNNGSLYEGLVLRTGGNLNRVIIDKDGNVAIGDFMPRNKLDVNGTIRAKEVIIETGWADYVFDDNYRLPPLWEIERFIKQNKHLPDIPSAAEIQKNGARVSELTTKMMQKIEELTLYSIEQQKEIAVLRNELKLLKNK